MRDALYLGTVIHKRSRPVTHKLRYNVFSLLVGCENFDEVATRCRLFSHNRFNLFSLYDRDFGDGKNLKAYLADITQNALGSTAKLKFQMLCYPRILGYGFNPLTVYYGFDADERVRLVIYEVNNTFGQRKSYAIPVEQERGIIAQECQKQLYVSPFNDVSGNYLFRLTPPDKELTVGVALKNETGPVLTAHFRGHRKDLDDRNLLSALARTGWVTVKVTAGIHYEALKLWMKGLTLKARPDAPKTPVSIFPKSKNTQQKDISSS